MAAPKTRNWSARENVHKPKGFHLLVCGGVEVTSLNKVPQLAKTDSRDPKVLGLALTVVTDPDEPSGDAMVWRSADYHEVVTPDQYTSVAIRWEGDVIERITVIDDREHGAALKKQVDAHNAAAAKTIKLKPAKPAPKKAAATTATAKTAAPKKAAKKKAPKAVGGWAKKAKKQTAKKTAKKSAKKAAKKSTFSKFVKKVVKKLTSAKKKKKR
jgi:flagellar hook-associated protein FlgK